MTTAVYLYEFGGELVEGVDLLLLGGQRLLEVLVFLDQRLDIISGRVLLREERLAGRHPSVSLQNRNEMNGEGKGINYEELWCVRTKIPQR